MTTVSHKPTTRAELEAFLDDLFEAEFTFILTGELAQQLSELPAEQRDYILHVAERIAHTHTELGFQFTRRAPAALEKMETKMVEAWAQHAMDAYDRWGLLPALDVLREVDRFTERLHEHTAGALLEEHQNVLSRFLNGLSGRLLKIQAGSDAYTDSETLFLPNMMARLPTARDNYLLFKASAILLWAQVHYGSFRIPLNEALQSSSDAGALLTLYHALETLRLEAIIERELPGIGREMRQLREAQHLPELDSDWRTLQVQLQDEHSTAYRALKLAQQYLHRLAPFPARAYQGRIDLEAVTAATADRIAREKKLFKVYLRQLIEEETDKPALGPEAPEIEKRLLEDDDHTPSRMELILDDKPVAPPEGMQRLATSIQLDLSEIPDEYLVPAGDGDFDPRLLERKEDDDEPVTEGDYCYHEWDHLRGNYRKRWCSVFERSVPETGQEFAEQAMRKHAGLSRQLRRTFEAMRDEDRRDRRQPDGEEVDLDALVDALADAKHGRELSSRLYTRLHRSERNIAAAFLVDMSGSTRGWINEAEREALLLLGEALNALGDRFAIYGFSGMTRQRCELFRIKEFDENWSPAVRARIGAIEPQDYTRMGFAIRHLNKILLQQEAKTRLMITLSDGKPDDLSDYRGDYGIEDTRRSLIESRRNGIHVYCITIDKEGPEYLPHLFGPAHYTVVDQIRQLPFKVADIYRRITT